ncbi:LacI family DNA-binding transcriptional regulator [Bifidobacterium adolescentis]|uniref:LacI family DNA-binding transcriptional regulator n=1 Tax=Bifidobacterium adolescentis TaxID=1680 RepID=UPI00189AB6C0|nr:LacI family DNA-binding transcriptional regulator [Bifidobacterium adolescentis]MDB1486435.1 LacI family DNA-binding transcriptional regulator [Bifidobacterium adolescentis]MDB1488133.1 LacI family DNA-binding transcriptional regulator [Bifidobacterium adolescentis]MDB1491619.1 LacI family DNA-binding transcriptional regulator [Bifidobacterium adolescentis]MDB1500436.1 LacI family DNA-binding transcriptional regulator [Bifidobacterium adolescentis]
MDRAGIREVAKAAGVSISTVSRAFTRPELVSERTRRKVLETADKLDFNISRSATSLKSGQTYRVAMLMNEEITSWFNTEVFAGIESVMHNAGYDVSLFQHVDTAENRRDFFTNLPVRRNVDAVFVTSFGVDPKEIQQLKRIHVPIIGINTPTQNGFDATISIDDEDGMFTAAQHLINLGHKNIVYVCSDAVDSINSSIDARGQGFIRACKTMEASHDFKWRVVSVPRGKTFADSALTALLALDEFPDAICCQMDMMAIPLVLRLERYGHHTPSDYLIIGFDDSPYADTVNLTTMRQDPYAMGRAAAQKAMKLIEGKPLENAHEIVRAQLVLRGTDSVYGTGR